jgi:hypothetical protein
MSDFYLELARECDDDLAEINREINFFRRMQKRHRDNDFIRKYSSIFIGRANDEKERLLCLKERYLASGMKQREFVPASVNEDLSSFLLD